MEAERGQGNLCSARDADAGKPLPRGGEHDRLDAISEAICRAWEKQESLRDERYFGTWLTRILIRECVNIQCRQKCMTPMEALPEGAADEPDEAVAALRAALDRLPQRLRTMAVLHYMEGYDAKEIAKMMGTTKSAVCAGLFRARGKLRAFIEEE